MDLMGIWGYEGYVGLRITCRGMRDCGDMRDMRDMRDCGTDHLLEITPAGLPFLGPPPPNPRRAENGSGKQPAIQKKECLFLI